jgi:translocation and assembly module TamB
VKESSDFALFGTADVVRGTVNVYGRQFEIEKGSINFRGEPYPNPALYIIATHKIRQQNTESLQIQVIVGGTALMPQLTLQSEPYLEQKDIISYLVFGKPFDFLTSGELKEMNGTYSEKMGAILVGIAARQLSQVIARQLNLDIVEFDLSQESNSAGFKVGKYLNDELFVLYTQDLKTQENQSLMIEYQLNKYLSIRASRTRKGDKEEQGIDMFYKKEW